MFRSATTLRLDDALLEQMALAGCQGINLGVETGDADLMASQGKPGGVTPEKVAEIRESAKRHGLKVHFLMMVGLPDETKETIYHSYQLLTRLKPETISVTAVSPFPGTELYKDAVENDWIISGDPSEHVRADGRLRARAAHEHRSPQP